MGIRKYVGRVGLALSNLAAVGVGLATGFIDGRADLDLPMAPERIKAAGYIPAIAGCASGALYGSDYEEEGSRKKNALLTVWGGILGGAAQYASTAICYGLGYAIGKLVP